MSRGGEPAVTVRGTVETVYFASPRFSAGRLRVDDATSVSFSARCMARAHDNVILEGTWRLHPKYGRQLEVQRLELDLRPSAAGLAHYLATHPALKGVGPIKAQKIADAFGDDFDRVIDEQPELVRVVGKLSRGAVEVLREEWLRTRTWNASLTWMSAFGLTHRQMDRLIRRYGNSAVTVLQTDPYLLVRELPGAGFKRIDLIARKLGTAKDHPGRVRAGLVHCVLERLEQGDCWVDYAALVEVANALLVMDAADSRAQIERSLDALIDDRTLACEGIGGRFLISRPDVLEQEQDIARLLMEQRGPNPHLCSARVPILEERLNRGQRSAVEAATAHKIVVISGPAGSGKSFVVGAITNLYVSRNLRVALAAPTGKAAKRLEQVVRREASTMHRLLGYTGKQFTRGVDEPLDVDVLIVDEVSMVDIRLAWHLLRAIDFRRTCLVLVGDHHQLPPVGAGNLLRDLIDRRPVPVVVLDEVVRQAGALQENSLAILRGEVRPTTPREPNGSCPWVIASGFTDALAAQAYILELFDRVLIEKLRFDLLADVQVLTPTRKGPLGTEELNLALQRVVQRKLWGVSVPAASRERVGLLLHDRVIAIRNNYDLGTMNGAIGTVTELDARSGELCVRFDGHEVRYTREAARELRLAYALTVHKAQGAEFPCVIAVVHKAHAYQHHRHLFYTAVTRARKMAIVVGDRWGIQHCAETAQVDQRKTFLSVLEMTRFDEAER